MYLNIELSQKIKYMDMIHTKVRSDMFKDFYYYIRFLTK